MAMAYAASCPDGVVYLQTESGFQEVARCGRRFICENAEGFEARVRTMTTFGEIVSIGEGEYGFQSHPHYGLPCTDHSVLIGVAIHDMSSRLGGFVLIGGAAKSDHLSAAQRYALQTHAAEMRWVFASDEQDLQIAAQPLERLRLLESVVVNAKDAILITEAEPIDLPGPRIVYSNPAFERTTGFSSREVLGLSPRILQSAETCRATLDKIRSALSQWEPIEVELVNSRKDGSLFWVELSIVPVADEKGWFTHWISVQRDITERKEAERLARDADNAWQAKIALESRLHERERVSAELAYAAYHDELTTLHNRAYLMAQLERIFAEPNEHKTVTVLFIDLDGFKLVNDSLGHLAGDDLLITISRRLKSSVREADVLARLGGDEFAVLITSPDHHSLAKELPQRIIDRIKKPIRLQEQDIFVSCSIGVVSADATHRRPDDLLRDADVAMYAAKNQGRGRWTWFDSSMRDAAVNQLMLQNALRQAVIEKDFVVFYQPIYSSQNRKLVGVEALLRWVHPTFGMIEPEKFITLAEDLGVIQELGAWVMRQAASDVQSWRNKYPAQSISLNVNVSGKELTRPGYLDQLAAILKHTGFPPESMQIEVTESVFLLHPELVAVVLHEIRALGIQVGLDDFGTGYSSLSYIDQYPIDAVKIDKSFVSRMMHLPRSKAIVESVLSLGRSLGLDIIAEGVETAEQLELLQQMECPFVQGYFLNRPGPYAEVDRILALLE
ncbi:EAL domain-containing protein [Xylophilus sp. Kf1]|nr:EAL domain-containing protein [Xylophilus sp. Kf1]